MKLLTRLATAALLSTVVGCTAPDMYIGDGVWRQDDGTTYEAPPPIEVHGVEVAKSRMAVTNNELGSFLSLEMLLQIALADGSVHQIWMTCEGQPGQRSYARSTFVAGNNRRYDVSAAVQMYEHDARATVNIRAPGPVQFQQVVDAY